MVAWSLMAARGFGVAAGLSGAHSGPRAGRLESTMLTEATNT